MLCFLNNRLRELLSKSSSSGIISINPVRLAKRSPWFR